MRHRVAALLLFSVVVLLGLWRPACAQEEDLESDRQVGEESRDAGPEGHSPAGASNADQTKRFLEWIASGEGEAIAKRVLDLARPLSKGLAPSLLVSLSEDEDMRVAMKGHLVRMLELDEQRAQTASQTVHTTNVLGYVIFGFVHFILCSALFFSGREILQAERIRAQPPQTHELQVSQNGLAVKTSLHGVLLLLIALAFYALYLKLVYPITVISGA
jgi:hypothetical protein